MQNKRYAEDANYWDTTVHPQKSLGEIQELLEDFGVTQMAVTQGQAGGRFAWLIRLEWPAQNIYTPIAARALLSLLSVPAAVTMAIRAQHTELLHEIREGRVRPAQPGAQPVAQPQPAVSKRVRILELHQAQPDASSSQIAREVEVSRQYVDKVLAGRANGRKAA